MTTLYGICCNIVNKMKKIFGLTIATGLSIVFLIQAGQVLANHKENDNKPLTSPITSPICKSGWGFGDKNHCHFGPPGKEKDHHENESLEHHNNHK